MKVYKIGHEEYRLPNELSEFRRQLYMHLIDWKWTHLTREAGKHKGQPYDAILPAGYKGEYHPLYRPIVARFLEHQKSFPFKAHRFLGHMASSQAACANLFLPMLQQPDLAARILRAAKSDLEEIATDHLDHGYRIEFWDEPDNMLRDHNPVSGTDTDIAIAYYDDNHDLNLWLIEHKLGEPEFTPCKGVKSSGRTDKHNCESMRDLLADADLCYYQSGRRYRYWDLTLSHGDVFPPNRLLAHGDCPFKGGTNQLWRNMLLALAVEDSPSPKWPYKKVFFSVVCHPGNDALQPSLESFAALLGQPDRFSHFPSTVLIEAAKAMKEPRIAEWVQWYEDLYYF